MSLGEQLLKPTAMMYRNLLAMEVEEVLRGYPVDGAILLGGCDKTTRCADGRTKHEPSIRICAWWGDAPRQLAW